jgi:F0F1-type ATP synthase membrane subunit a
MLCDMMGVFVWTELVGFLGVWSWTSLYTRSCVSVFLTACRFFIPLLALVALALRVRLRCSWYAWACMVGTLFLFVAVVNNVPLFDLHTPMTRYDHILSQYIRSHDDFQP